MRKAFDKNVPRRRPRLKRAAVVEGLAPDAPGAAQPLALVSQPTAPPPPPQTAGDAAGRRERLEKIKRKVAEIAAPAPRVEMEKIRRRLVRLAPPVGPLPAVPARAPGNVQSLVEALGTELARARQREEALRGELHAARGELARATGQARGASERLAAAYADYLLQVTIRKRTQLAQAPGHNRPATVLCGDGVARGEAAGNRTDPQGGLRRHEGSSAPCAPPHDRTGVDFDVSGEMNEVDGVGRDGDLVALKGMPPDIRSGRTGQADVSDVDRNHAPRGEALHLRPSEFLVDEQPQSAPRTNLSLFQGRPGGRPVATYIRKKSTSSALSAG
jgi:hypothetical protein